MKRLLVKRIFHAFLNIATIVAYVLLRVKLLNQWAIDIRMRLNYFKSIVMWFKTSNEAKDLILLLW